MLADYHSCCSVGHLVVAIADKLLLNVCPLAVADLQLVSHHSQNEACLVVAPHLLKLSSLHHQSPQNWQMWVQLVMHHTMPKPQLVWPIVEMNTDIQSSPHITGKAD